MQSLEIKKLKIEDFKGITHLEIPGTGDQISGSGSEISGANGLGKSSIKEAIAFLITGRNSLGSSDKFIRESASETLVSAELELVTGDQKQDVSVQLARGIREKHSQKRGEDQVKGFETTAYIEGTEVKVSQLEDKIRELINPDTFLKLYTPGYFQSLNWQKKRETVISLVGDVTEPEIAEDLGYSELTKSLSNTNSADLIKRYKKEQKSANEALERLGARIEEKKSEIPEDSVVEQNEARIRELKEEIAELEKRPSDSANSEADVLKQKLDQKVNERLNKLNREHEQTRKDLNKTDDQCYKSRQEYEKLSKELERLRDEKNQKNDELKRLREQYKQEAERDTSVPDHCDSCGQPIPQELRQDYIQNKEDNKQSVLKELETAGEKISGDIERLNREEQEQQNEARRYETEVNNLESESKRLRDYLQKLLKTGTDNIEKDEEELSLEQQFEEVMAKESEGLDQHLQNKKGDLEDALKQQTSEDKDKILARVTELERQAELESSRFAEAQRIIDQLEEISRSRIDRVEEKAKEAFSNKETEIAFRFFEERLNGEIKEDCRVLVNGQELSSLSFGEAIRAGTQISLSLMRLYGISCPVFVDNAESISGDKSLYSKEAQFFIASVTDEPLKIRNL